MKKVGIVTLYTDSCNYGGLLQAYALEHYLISKGYDAKQICYRISREESKENRQKYLKRMAKSEGIAKCLFQIIKSSCRLMAIKINTVLTKVSDAKISIRERNRAVREFRDDIIHTEKVYDGNTISTCNEFDVYVCGSDQIWHGITKYGDLNTVLWLKFVHDPYIKLSYAASVSLPEIPKQAEGAIREALKGFKAISVRENIDKEALNRILTDRNDVECVLDPTLLLSCSEWDSLCEGLNNDYGEYIFAYLISGKKEDREFITDFANRKKLKIITIPYLLGTYRKCDRKFGDIKLSAVSPQMWIALIKGATYVFTDSFHGTVFSILFHKEFFTFKRDKDNVKASMNSRLYSLFQMFEIADRLVSNEADVSSIDNIEEIDYNRVDHILMQKKQESERFLLDAIES